MYKWIWNFLRITGNPERIKELKERANLDGRVFNFEAFVPVDREDRRYFSREEGVNDKYRLELWRNDHWGTEQNAKDAKIKEEEPDSIFYIFQTAEEDTAVWFDECKVHFQKGPARFARVLKNLYPDLDIDWSCQGPREWSNLDIEFDFYDENGGLLGTWEDPRLEFRNTVTMDEENAKKFKKLYDKDDEWNWFSLAMVIPEPANESEEWTDFSMQRAPCHLSWECFFEAKKEYLVNDVGHALAAWRYENWGTPSEAMYDENDCDVFISPHLLCRSQLPEQLKNKVFRFYTLSFPPLKIYRKMAADGLVFKAEWESDAYGDWAYGEGRVANGCFLYEAGPITGSEKWLIKKKDVFKLENDENDGYEDVKKIVVKNRKHLDQLLACVKDKIKEISDSLDNGDYCLNGIDREDISMEEKNGIKEYKLEKPFDLNFLDVSRVTDMSGLFNGFCSLAWFKIKLDISQWDVSNVTKMAHMFEGCDNVDFGDLSRWDRSKVTDC